MQISLASAKNSNTSDAIIEFLDYVYSSLDSKQSTIAVYLDFSKEFDTVIHNILMSKLLHNGVRGVQHWFESYLSSSSSSSSSSRTDRGVHFQQNAGLQLFFNVHT